jgi:hypothetical protein
MKKEKTYQLKNVSGGHINIPAEVWKHQGWDLNDEVILTSGDIYNDKDESWKAITIERVKDLEKYSDEYDGRIE